MQGDGSPSGASGMQTFFFYDLETTGLDPRWHRICQFAGVRTDADLEIIDEPVSWLARIEDEVVPDPDAALVTGLTPRRCAAGIDDRELFARIDAAFSRPRTCVAGYNNLRFDDEFVRYGLYRNLRDPYGREWRSGNSRWDLIDLARMTAALRPDGLHWPHSEEGRPEFRLERLAEVNGIEQARAHDALSDVLATLGLARALRGAQPRLFDYYLGLRDKRAVSDLLLPLLQQPVVHVSGRYGAARHCLAIVVAVAMHPVNRNSVIVADLWGDVDALVDLDAEAIAARLFMPRSERGDLPPIPLKEVHLNRVPALAPLAVVRPQDSERLGLDLAAAQAALTRLQQAPGLASKVAEVYAPARREAPVDVDGALYAGFLPDADRDVLIGLRDAPAEELGSPPPLQDPRARELVELYRARNHPDSLAGPERARYAARVVDRLRQGRPGMLSVDAALRRVDTLLAEGGDVDVLGELREHYVGLAERWLQDPGAA